MKQFFKNKNNLIIGLFAIVILMGIGFAAYSQRLTITDTASSDSNWNVYIKSVTPGTKVGGASGSGAVEGKLTANLTTELKYPGDSITYTIVVANAGNIDAMLEEITLNQSNNDSVVKYSYAGIAKNDSLLKGEEKSFTVKVEYDSTKTGTATTAQKTNELTLNLDYVQKTSGGSTGGTPSNQLAADQLKDKAVTTGDGLYADSYESGRYVYKGASPDNYITYNNEMWRIISVESDGTLKIMRNESIGNKVWDETGGTYGSNNWARPADLNTYLNSNTEGNYYYGLTEEAKNLIQSHIWGVGAVTYGNTDLAGQITSENNTTWTGNIALISASDYLRANTNTEQCGNFSLNNTNYTTCKTTNWIFSIVPSGDYLWTVSPHAGTSYGVFYVRGRGNYAGAVNGSSANSGYGVAPTLYLKSGITLEGEGSSSSPYQIVQS